MEIFESVGRFSLFLIGGMVVAVSTTLWCLFVFLLTGRFSWMVRKYL